DGRAAAEVGAAVETEIVSKGHGYEGTRTVRAAATVLSGPQKANVWQYILPRDRRIEPDEVVMLELGTCADGYWSDHTRTIVAGRATDQQRQALAAVREAA